MAQTHAHSTLEELRNALDKFKTYLLTYKSVAALPCRICVFNCTTYISQIHTMSDINFSLRRST